MSKTRNFKKALSLVLVLMMVVSTMVLVPLTASAEGVEIDGVDGTGVEGDPYVLSTADECTALSNNLANLVSPVYVELDADIAVADGWALKLGNWGGNYFTWIIDGKDHTLSNFSAKHLIGQAAADTVIKNLTLVGTNQTIKPGESYCGVFVGYTPGAVTFENCTVKDVTLDGEGNRALGGFVGLAEGAITIKNCVSDMTLLAGVATGGFVGESVSAVVIENSTNKSLISSVKTNAGGFIGKAPAAVTIKNCLNEGNVTGVTTAGGAIGYAGANVTAEGFINIGNVTASGDDANWSDYVAIVAAGGLLGNIAQEKTVTLTNAINKGTISASKTSNAAAFVGHDKSATLTFTNCYDDGVSNRNLIGNASKATEITTNKTLADVYAGITPPKAITAENTSAVWVNQAKSKPNLVDNSLPNSAENPFLISSGEELAWFSGYNYSAAKAYYNEICDENNVASVYLKLTKNINMGGYGWSAIMTQVSNVTSGGPRIAVNMNVDGDNFTIYNLSMPKTGGVFTGIEEPNSSVGNLTLTNLHFAKIIVNATLGSAGIILPGVGSGSTVTLNNVTTAYSCAIYSNGSKKMEMGGFIGVCNAGGTLIINNCINATSVGSCGTNSDAEYDGNLDGAPAPLGGFVGVACSGSTVQISNAINEGGVGLQITGANRTGAIVGIVFTENATISNVFSSSALANAYASQGATISYTNCYTPSEARNSVNATAIAAILAAAHTYHVYTNVCDADCNVCGEEKTPAPNHVYDNNCDDKCNVCDESRTAPHEYDNDCDAECNACEEPPRTPPHVYDSVCDDTCNACGETRTVLGHVYDNDCDAVCNNCDEPRTAPHVYDNVCDDTCNACGETRTVSDHVYDDDADTDCNLCGAVRTVETAPVATETTTTAAAAEEEVVSGCFGALNSTYAVLALVAVLGFAFVAKKKEEN